MGGIKRNDEIWVYMARFFNNYKVALRPGVTGKQLATGPKALNDRLRPPYDLRDLPCGLANRYCIWAASKTWGGRPSGPDYIISEQDYSRWALNQFDSYSPPFDWSLETKARPSAHIEAWRINAQNMTKNFYALYGADHLQERMADVADIRALHISEPLKFTLPSIRGEWGNFKLSSDSGARRSHKHHSVVR